MAGGSCLLGSLNLSEFVVHPFTKKAYFDEPKFLDAINTAVIGLNQVLDEGMYLHPLQIQQENARDWRQIGLGIMGLGDMFIKLGIRYGSEDSIKVSDRIGGLLFNGALQSSAKLAKKEGAFPKYDEESLFKSEFFNRNATEETKEIIKEFGLRNSQILTIAPTGSISTMWGVSGGMEPIFATSYKRKTESIHGTDMYYDVYTPIVKEMVEVTKSSELPDYIVTAHDLNWKDRVVMQGTWQKWIDASISSTVNLHNSFTIEDVESIFMYAWEQGCKGITIFRDGCKRSGILTIDDETESENSYEEDNKYSTCPDCGSKIEIVSGGCTICSSCGYSPCS